MFGATNNVAPTDTVAETTPESEKPKIPATPAPVSKKKKSKKRAASKKVATKARRSTVKKATKKVKKTTTKKTTPKTRAVCQYELTSAGRKATYLKGSFAEAVQVAMKKLKKATVPQIVEALKKAKIKSANHKAGAGWWCTHLTEANLARKLGA